MRVICSPVFRIATLRVTYFAHVTWIGAWLIVVLLASHGTCSAQHGGKWRTWRFEPHSYYDPLAAEPRSAETKLLFLGRASSVPFALNPGQSFIWDISVGAELPIVGRGTGDKANRDSPAAAHEFAFGVWIPVSFHMVEDLGKDPSNPILDTDYRFGAMLKAQYGLGDRGIMRSRTIGLRYVPIAHESTHIGDEFTVGAIQKYPNQFERVNVSYQYYELGGSCEGMFLNPYATGALHTAFRAGFIHEAFHNGVGWYDTQLLYPIGGSVTASKRNYEPYMGAEAVFFGSRGHIPRFLPVTEHLGLFTSVDIRDRTIYGYHRPSAAVPEKTEWSVNSMLGWREQRTPRGFQPSYYVRYYHGVNPAGQFRSQANYQMFGLGLMVHF